jgi:glycosyltransferase involved in cell wall biosynthesis
LDKKKIAFVARAWFPDHQSLLERIQAEMPDVSIYYVLLSGVEAGRSWIINDSMLRLIHVPYFKIFLFRKEIVINYSIHRILNGLAPDLLIVTPWSEFGIFSAMRWASTKKIPCIGLAVGPRVFHWSFLFNIRFFFTRHIIKLFVARLNELMVYGPSVGKQLERLIGPIKCGVTITKHSVDHHKFLPRSDLRVIEYIEKFRKLHSELDGRYIIGYVGQLIKRKGVEAFLESAERLIVSGLDISILVVGKGLQKKNVDAFSAKFPGRLIFISYLNEDDFRYVYSVMDIAVMPSFFEDWGHVVNEALLCETPVVASTGVYSACDLLENDRFGLLYPVNKPDALHQALLYALANMPGMKKKAILGREFLLNNWNLDVSSKIWVDRLYMYVKNDFS